MKRIKVLIWSISVFLIILANFSLANRYLKEGYEFSEGDIGFGGGYIIADNNQSGKHAFEYTLKEASEITKTGNPLDLVVAYKEDEDRTGKIDSVYQDVGLYDYSYDGQETHTIIDDLRDVHGDIKYNLNNNIIPKNDNTDYIKEKNKNSNLRKNLIIVILLVILIVLFVIKKNKVFLIIGITISIYAILSFFIVKQLEGEYNYIERYILGISNQHIAKTIDVNKSINDMKDKLNSKRNISNLINDYIIKLNSCINLCSNNEKIRRSIIYNDDSHIIPYFDIINDTESNYEFFNAIALYKYNEYDSVKSYHSFDEWVSNEILKDGILYEDMLKIYDYIKKVGKQEFAVLMKDVLQNVKFNNPSEDELLFHYLARIVKYYYISQSCEYYDNSVISYFKDWYIDGESCDIELPYGVTLEYRAPEFVKKDIKEILYTNEQELDHDSKEKQVYVMYYRDSKGKLGASYTDIEFTKTGRNYEILFNPIDLMYDIKKPTVRLVVK